MHAAEQPAEAKRDSDRRVRLRFDRDAQRTLERACGLARRPVGGIGEVGGAVDGVVIEILSGVRRVAGNAAGLFLGG
jgi:hypothetical protein